jgi:hypothetical protein
MTTGLRNLEATLETKVTKVSVDLTNVRHDLTEIQLELQEEDRNLWDRFAELETSGPRNDLISANKDPDILDLDPEVVNSNVTVPQPSVT